MENRFRDPQPQGQIMQDKHIIVGVHIHDRLSRAAAIQQVFTEFGCNIKTRLGLHEASEDFCAINGVVLLEMVGDEKRIQQFQSQLGAIEGVDVACMVFAHEV
jgi:metal-responsive CopG/Arc/MetJ family transcriptional regulator